MKTRGICGLLSFMLMFTVLVSCGNSRKDRAEKPGSGKEITQEQPKEKPEESNQEKPAKKPRITGILVRLTGDNGVSIIDGHGKVLARNFTPYVNGYGNVDDFTTPVIDDIFSVCRDKQESVGSYTQSITVYRGIEDPRPIDGLTDLYSANIFNPDLFPISKKGERIKFVDRNGNVKFTVMPIDGMEPRSVDPYIEGGLFFVQATDLNKNEKRGAIDSRGNWVVRPEWDILNFMNHLTAERLHGLKDGKWYHIDPTTGNSSLVDINAHFDSFCSDYYIEEVYPSINLYDLDGRFITTIDSVSGFSQCQLNKHLFIVGDWRNSKVIDITNGNRDVSRFYYIIDELPNGDFLARDRDGGGGYKSYYFKSDGSETRLPDNMVHVLRSPCIWRIFDIAPFMFIIDDTNGYLCDEHGNKVGDYTFDEYFNKFWVNQRVESSYWMDNIGNRSN